ncbi:hypothetical protein IC765_14205 [Acinetobacter seifertii]|uniref:Uncharacterized protein n=1 Tax=Acinetobacter seifertii TaxID=1530123 RepID=A0A7H2YUD6_9GAMM|nr:hypothetical protein IC795_13705 [Acinetobacter seifertii]QNY16720.1 hypothetical protein IC765_14205 [Acinetobacter seifertii]
MDQIALMRVQALNGKISYWKIYQTLASLLQSNYGYQASDPTVLVQQKLMLAVVQCLN